MFDSLTEKLTGALKRVAGFGRLSEKNISEALGEVRLSLLEADVNFQVVKDFIETVKQRALGEEVQKHLNPSQMFIKTVHEELVRLLGENDAPLNLNLAPPVVVMLAGLQGSGKTTSTAKLGLFLRDREKRTPLLVSVDVYRPAAIEQLRSLGQRYDLPVAESSAAGKPVDIARAAIEQAKREGLDVVLIDTAGRLQIDEELMVELEELRQATEPAEILFVADAMTGQEAVNVAKTFDERLAVDGVVLTKLDGDARGGAALSIKAVTGKPIKFVGVGEKASDLEAFHPDRMASRILGMGDVLSLIEKAEQRMDAEKAAKLEKKMRRNAFDLDDFRDAILQMRRLGSVESIFKMLPGMPPALKKAQNFATAENELKRVEAIINSMTPRERENHQIINGSCRKRIAAGSGTKVQDVNRLLKSYLEMRKMMKKMTRGGMPDLGALLGGRSPF